MAALKFACRITFLANVKPKTRDNVNPKMVSACADKKATCATLLGHDENFAFLAILPPNKPNDDKPVSRCQIATT